MSASLLSQAGGAAKRQREKELSLANGGPATLASSALQVFGMEVPKR